MIKKDKNLVVLEYIHLLDLPTYVLDEKGNRKELDIIKPEGTFTMASTKSLPTHFDNKVLYCLLTKIIKDEKVFTHEVKTTRYAISTMLYKGKINSGIFNRITNALEKYKYTIFRFEGKFYSQEEETVRLFSYIDDVVFNKKTKELYVKFNQQYMTLIKESGLIKYINFDIYNSFNLAVSARLYQILCKVLEYNTSWSIGLQNLAEKMTLQKRSKAKSYYASDVLAKIKPGVNEISHKSPLKINFTYNKASDVVTFKRVKKASTSVVPAKKTVMKEPNEMVPVVENQMSKYVDLFKSLSSSDQEFILDNIKREPFLEFLPTHDEKVFAFMSKSEKWKQYQRGEN
jgi:hypothetical protein